MKKIVILATGGTIAGVGEPGKNTGYESGQINAHDLVAGIPELQNVAEISVEQVCNVNSDDITAEIWLGLAQRVRELCASKDVDGIVITHGTDTMDETAFFLALTLDVCKPVILTGAMRPATAVEPDGPSNLLGAVKSAVAMEHVEKGACVWVFFGGSLFDAWHVQKCSASDLRPMASDSFLMNGEKPFFEISNISKLPKVNVVYFAVDADSAMLEYAAQISDGVVIAGAGSGEFSKEFSGVLKNVQVPVVVSSRINHGLVTLNENLAPGRVSAGHLPPQKAAIALRLALATHRKENIKEVFGKF